MFSAVFFASANVFAEYLGMDDFEYSDGEILGKNGGTGFERVGTKSSWELAFGQSSNVLISNNKLKVTNGGARRSYGSDAHNSAVKGAGKVFFTSDLTIGDANSWGGMSSFDFGAERVFFGWKGGKWRIEENGVSHTESPTLIAESGKTYKLIAMVDFDNDRVRFWINPTGSSKEDTADIERVYTPNNWHSAVRLGSGGDAQFDNFKVSTTFEEALNVPEPATMLLLLGGAAGLISRKSRRPKTVIK